jgi:hypothetical protein
VPTGFQGISRPNKRREGCRIFRSCSLVTGDESWSHYQTPELKRQFTQWKHKENSRPKKFRTTRSAGKQMASVFWDTEGILLIEWLPQGQTINSEVYCNTLYLRRRNHLQRQGKWTCQVLLLHDNARPYNTKQTTQPLVSLGYTVLPHPTYSPDLVPSEYALFNKMKESLRGSKFPTGEHRREVSATQCAVSLKTLPLSESYQRYFKRNIDLVGRLSKVLQRDFSPVISRRPVSQVSVNHL